MAINVTLLDKNEHSSAALAVGSARTCYASKPIIINDLEYQGRLDLNEQIRKATLQAGHNTTRQHNYFTFVLEGISRQAIWSFLHSHPFYNSEQVSQRYVPVQKESFVIPKDLNESQKQIFTQGTDLTFEAYHKLQDLLLEPAEKAYYQIFGSRAKNPDKWQKDIQKKGQEVARYILPVATEAFMYHTISQLTLMRLYQCVNLFNLPTEQREIVKEMVDAVCEDDPTFEKELNNLKAYGLEDSLEYRLHQEFFNKQKNPPQNKLQEQSFPKEFDFDLGELHSRLKGYYPNAQEDLALAVRTVMGMSKQDLPDAPALDYLLNPLHNKILADTNNLTTMTKLGSAMAMISYSFAKKLSHTADSQNQRHRMVMETSPIFQLTDKPDVLLPSLIQDTPLAKEYFLESCEELWGYIAQLKNSGASEEAVQYLAPNATAIRIIENGNLRDRWHKYSLRLCFNAQEEIRRNAVEEVQQINQVHPLIGKYLLPPCSRRGLSGEKPYCPEGSRYCGVPVWKKGMNEYKRTI